MENFSNNPRPKTKESPVSILNNTETLKKPAINYIDIVIDDDYLQKNLLPGGALRMKGGHANWNGEVDLMRYSISEKLSPEHHEFVKDKIDKMQAGQEKTYQHESHHIRNREHGLTPHVAAGNLREFLSFRVLDELSPFTTRELYNKELSVENILDALKTSDQRISGSYYGQPFIEEANWYISQHADKPEIFSREINTATYHAIMKHYFNVNGTDILSLLQKDGKLSEFTKIVNNLILKLDPLLADVNH